MKTRYKILDLHNSQYTYGVEEEKIYEGKRLNAYESEQDKYEYEIIYKSNSLSDCVAFLTAKKNKWL